MISVFAVLLFGLMTVAAVVVSKAVKQDRAALQSSRPVGFPTDEELSAAFAIATQKAVQEHWDAGRSVPTRIDGKIVWVPPPVKEPK